MHHSSHELRTPISVIRNNIELLQKPKETYGTGMLAATEKEACWKHQQKKVINRIDRASLTIKHLTETLLWLSLNNKSHLPKKDLDLESLVRELTTEADYLLRDKNVEVDLDTESFIIQFPGSPARIVTGNLIRNAFQHTWRGRV